MKGYFRNYFFFFLLFTLLPAMPVWSQANGGNPSYRFEGNEVVFEFDIREYQYAIDQGTEEFIDFADLKIYDVAISGNFNNWSDRGWKMKKKGKFVYELRKNISDFSDPFEWEFRYVINGKHIIVQALNFKDKLFNKEFFKNTFDLDVNEIKISDTGAVRFYLQGYGEAKEVYLAGNFNGWDPNEIRMHKIADGWEIRGDLPPDRYEYKFIVDHEWIHDPDNPHKRRNEHFTFNSILEMTRPITFTLDGNQDAEMVVLAGSFNDWNEDKLKMQRYGDQWQITIDLIPGKHLYKFIVDNRWIVDPENQIWENDGKGNTNSVLLIR